MNKEAKDGVLNIFEDFKLNDDYDPFELDEADIDEEIMEGDDSYILPDYSGSQEVPKKRLGSVYTPERAGSVQEAVGKLLKNNPGRREILLSIIDLSRTGELSSVISEQVDRLQADNRSIYTPMSLCRMLERAGALELEMPEVSEEHVDVDEGMGYLTINEQTDPVWRATEEGLAAYDELTQGNEWREVVFDADVTYAEVYCAVMQRMNEGACSKDEINDLAGTFEITKSPRRFGTHFIDLLEKTGAAIWVNQAWELTDLGKTLLPELTEFCESRAQVQISAL